jgi:hypothetical protein
MRSLAPLALVVIGSLAAGLRAADPPPPALRHADLDRLAVEVLKDLHNRGADLYNAADAAGALRLYEGSLRAVAPFLAHRPRVQAVIADGLADTLKLDGTKAQAFRLHEVMEQARAELKAAMKADEDGKPAPMPEPKKPDPTPEPKKSEPKPVPSVGSLTGVVTLGGKPLAKVDVTIVSLTLPAPRVFTATTDDAGKFAFPAELPPADYAAMVTGGGDKVPAKYRSTMTSGLQVVVKAGEQTTDVKLQSK